MVDFTSEEKTNGIATSKPGMKLYDEAYVKALEVKAAAYDSMHVEPVTTAAASAPDPLKTVTKVFMGELQESDLEARINDGWQKWHAEFKGSKLHVVLTREAPADPVPQPEQKASATPPAEPVGAHGDALSPEPTITPVGEPLTIVVAEPELTPVEMTPAERYKAESNARILAAARDATIVYFQSRPQRNESPFVPSIPMTVEVSRV